jgi:hypothetical protein
MYLRLAFVLLWLLVVQTNRIGAQTLGSDANFKACLVSTESQCNLLALTTTQFADVRQAALGRNWIACIWNQPTCNRSLLTTDERAQVAARFPESPAASTPAAANASAPSTAPASAAPATATVPRCAENGSCPGDISTATGRPKTVYVQGYTRKDGTYVRGHYRSKGNRE